MLMINSLQCRYAFCIFTDGITSVHVPVNCRKVAAGDVDAYPVPFCEHKEHRGQVLRNIGVRS